jgi:hypothetical protein
MKGLHLVTLLITASILTGCQTTTQFRKVSVEDAFSDIRKIEESYKAQLDEEIQSLPDKSPLYTQPANKSVPCKLPTTQDQLDRSNFRAFWDGECKDGFAFGLGRGIAISDTHHVEEIAFYEDTSKNAPTASVYYDFANQTVNYRLFEDEAHYLLQETIINEGENFSVGYQLIEYSKNGDRYVMGWSPFSFEKIRVNITENIAYTYRSYNPTFYSMGSLVQHFQTLDVTGSPVGYEYAVFADGKVEHLKVDSGEIVELPKSYFHMTIKKIKRINKSNSLTSQKIEQVKIMEEEYRQLACHGKHEIVGLEKKIFTKFCTWRDQFKEPFELSLKRFKKSLEQLKAKDQEQLVQKKSQWIGKQVDYYRGLAKARQLFNFAFGALEIPCHVFKLKKWNDQCDVAYILK